MKKHKNAYKKLDVIMKDDYARYLLLCSYVGGHFEPLSMIELMEYRRTMDEEFDRLYEDDYDDYEEWFDAGEQEEVTE